jgi:hypothetical protein
MVTVTRHVASVEHADASSAAPLSPRPQAFAVLDEKTPYASVVDLEQKEDHAVTHI